MNPRAAAERLGGDVVRNRILCPGPGHSAADRSLQVTFDTSAPEGFLVHSFCGDDWLACRDHVRDLLGLPPWQPGDEQDRRVAPDRLRDFDRRSVDAESGPRPLTDSDRSRIARAQAIWHEAQDPRRTLAEAYFVLRRLKLDSNIAGHVLRFHPRTPWRNEKTGCTDRVPALIAAFRSLDGGEITAVHRIALDRNGHKLGRRMLGVVHRAAIKLDHNVSSELAVCEGLETGVAARMLGIAPTWALGSVGMIAQFPLLPGITTLRIVGENDAASAQAIELCGTRWQRAGRRVRVIKPTLDRKDLNDTLGAHAYDGSGR